MSWPWPWPVGEYWGLTHERFVIGADPGDHRDDIIRMHGTYSEPIYSWCDARVNIADDIDKSELADAIQLAMEEFIYWAQFMPFSVGEEGIDPQWWRYWDDLNIPTRDYHGAQVGWNTNPSEIVWGLTPSDLICEEQAWVSNKFVLVDMIEFGYPWTGGFPGPLYPGWECRVVQALQRAKERVIEIESMEAG